MCILTRPLTRNIQETGDGCSQMLGDVDPALILSQNTVKIGHRSPKANGRRRITYKS